MDRIAPEMIDSAKCSTKVDVYSFGCILYEIILEKHCYYDRNMKSLTVRVSFIPFDLSIQSVLFLATSTCVGWTETNASTRNAFRYVHSSL